MSKIKSPYYIQDTKVHELDNDLILQGYSRSASRTGFLIKSKTKPIEFFLDAGMASTKTPNHLFISHSHLDHSDNFHFLVHRRKDMCTHVYCPDVVKPLLQDLIYHMQKLNNCVTILGPKNQRENIVWHTFTTDKNDECDEEVKVGKNMIVKPVKCVHSVPSLGYEFYETRTKLKEKYKKLSGLEIKTLRDFGEDVTYDVVVPIFTFMGDTNVMFMKNYAIKTPVFIIECTSFDDNDDDEAITIGKGHMHFRHILKLAKTHQDVKFVLIHFSKRYRYDQLYEIEKTMLLENMMMII